MYVNICHVLLDCLLSYNDSVAAADLHGSSFCLVRFYLQGHSSWMCGRWQMKKSLPLCLRSMRKATHSSSKAKSRRPQTSTTMALPASKIYRWRLVSNSHRFLVAVIVFTYNIILNLEIHCLTLPPSALTVGFSVLMCLLFSLSGASWRWKMGEAGLHDHTTAPQLLPVQVSPGPVLRSHRTLLLPDLQIWRWS